jgi:hypothetical protein
MAARFEAQDVGVKTFRALEVADRETDVADVSVCGERHPATVQKTLTTKNTEGHRANPGKPALLSSTGV